MISFKRQSRRTVRSVRFVPEGVGEQTGARLESRALTAPAFWRQPVPLGDQQGTYSSAIGAVSPTPVWDYQYDMYNSVATASLTGHSVPAGLSSVSWTGYATANINDIAQTFAPDAPVGSAVISGNTAARWQYSWSGDENEYASIIGPEVKSQAGREYVIADDSSTPESTTFVGNASINLIGSTNSASLVTASVSFTHPNFGMSVRGNGEDGFKQATISGATITVPSSGSFTYLGSSISYSVTSTTFLATISAPLNALPTVSRGTLLDPNVVRGIYTSVGTNATISNIAVTPGSDNGELLLTTHYDAYFEDV